MTTPNDWQDVYSYYKQSMDLLDPNHPHYHEIRSLLMQQVNDEMHTISHSIPSRDRRASTT